MLRKVQRLVGILTITILGESLASAQCPYPRIVNTSESPELSYTGTCSDKFYNLVYRILQCQPDGTYNDQNPTRVVVRSDYLVLGACYAPYYTSRCTLEPAGSLPGLIRTNVAGCDGEYGCFHVWWTTGDQGQIFYAGYQPPIDCGGGNYGEMLASSTVETDFVYYQIVWP